ncbi:MAG: hypothetical protein ABI867_31860 [Kofleriaceae bacterium]
MSGLWLVCIVFPALVAGLHVMSRKQRKKKRTELPKASARHRSR